MCSLVGVQEPNPDRSASGGSTASSVTTTSLAATSAASGAGGAASGAGGLGGASSSTCQGGGGFDGTGGGSRNPDCVAVCDRLWECAIEGDLCPGVVCTDAQAEGEFKASCVMTVENCSKLKQYNGEPCVYLVPYVKLYSSDFKAFCEGDG